MGTTASAIPRWTVGAPLLGWLALAGSAFVHAPAWIAVLAAGLMASVVASVHHAEVIAHRTGEPFGTLVLAGAVTVIEVALIVTLMLAGGAESSGLARDTVFATVMIILNGIVGLCLVVGGSKHGEQAYSTLGANAGLSTLAAIVVMALVLPNFTTTTPGPFYSPHQLAFVAAVSSLLYGTFVFVQSVRHRHYFVAPGEGEDHGAPEPHAAMPSNATTAAAGALLAVCLGAVVLLAKGLSPFLEAALDHVGAPPATGGVIIAAVVLLPEGLAAVRAARANRLQTSLNLAIGSALASIGLTIPAVALVSLRGGWPLALGIDPRSTVLLLLTLQVATLSLATGRSTVLQGAIHLVVFAVYLFTTVVP